jgi:hypothetical protein
MYGYLPPSGAGTTYKPITNTYGTLTYGAADGGRVPAAYGGRMGYAGGGDIRQRYLFGGLGKLFKGITKPFKGITRGIKKLTKSKAGKLAIMAALGYGTGMFGGGSGMFGSKTGGSWLSKLGKTLIGGPGKGGGMMPWQRKGTMWSPDSTGWLGKAFLKGGADKWSLANISPLKSTAWLGLLSLLDKGGDENDMWNKWYAKYDAENRRLNPLFVPENFRRIDFSAPAADGGRIGYADGLDWKSKEERGPLYIDPESVKTRDTPLTDFESDLRFEPQENRKKMYYKMLELLHGMSDKEKKEFLHLGRYNNALLKERALEYTDDPVSEEFYEKGEHYAQGGRIGYAGGYNVDDDEEDKQYIGRRKAQEGGLMNLGGMEKDYRNDGGFVPIGGQERADDVPARLSKNEFVFTADAVRAAGGGDIDAGAEIMENVMENLEQGGEISQQSQGLEGARNMFATSQRLEGVL